MHLYINTRLTDLPHPFCDYTRVDILKYSLASLSVINFTGVTIRVALDSPHDTYAQELEELTKSLFPGCQYESQNTCVEEWKERLPEDLKNLDRTDPVWFLCNHDHIFLASDCEELEYLQTLFEVYPDKNISVQFSHWPELFWKVSNTYLSNDRGDPYFNHMGVDSVVMIGKETLQKAWNTFHLPPNTYRPRTDYGPPPADICLETYIPIKNELCRHFDGYSHVGISQTRCPALKIPPGFWTKDIVIRYEYPENEKHTPHSVIINPLLPYHSANPNGVDIQGVLEDIPLFWKPYIKDIDINPNIPSREALLIARNKAHTDMATSYRVNVNQEWIEKGFLKE